MRWDLAQHKVWIDLFILNQSNLTMIPMFWLLKVHLYHPFISSIQLQSFWRWKSLALRQNTADPSLDFSLLENLMLQRKFWVLQSSDIRDSFHKH